MDLPHFDITTIPFSRRGSWLSLSPIVGLHDRREHIHLVSHQTGIHPILRIELSAEVTEVAANPATLTWIAPAGRIEAAFESLDTVRLRGHGVGARLADAAGGLTPFTGTYLFVDPRDGAVVLTSYETGRRYRVTLLEGTWEVMGDQLLGAGDRHIALTSPAWEVAIEEYETTRPPYRQGMTLDECAAHSAQDFDAYARAIAPWEDGRFPAARRAAYVLWSATVSPKGFVQRESVLMSKHWMNKVWSWDHCFNALALAPGLPQSALDQFLVVFDHQDEHGAVPDSVTHSEILDNFVKPPIHGWALCQLLERLEAPPSRGELAEIYDKLARWTEFWLDSRRVPGSALPHYQHGNDSGWDNSTMFDNDRVVEAPDLAAFLVLQLSALVTLGTSLGHDVGRWERERDAVEGALFSRLHTGDGFVAIGVPNGRVSTTSSLLNLMPIVLGERLTADVASRLSERIAAHLTQWGLATELPSSREYLADGYWRGPIWAPSTVLIEDGLRRAGATDLANEISERFRGLCEASGFAENFDALTGEGLRDRAYTWTASAYLLLCAQAAERERTAAA